MKPKKKPNPTGFKIEKGVPIPSPKGRGRHFKYPFLLMEVGDSFLIACGGNNSSRRMASYVAAISRRHPGYSFSVRQTPEGVRVWRVKGKKTK